jgi:hypothetical protein
MPVIGSTSEVVANDAKLPASAQENSLNVIFPRIGEMNTTDNIIGVLRGC